MARFGASADGYAISGGAAAPPLLPGQDGGYPAGISILTQKAGARGGRSDVDIG